VGAWWFSWACWASSVEGGPGNEKEKRKINSKLISGFKKFRKMNKEILVVEIIGKFSPKIVIIFENQECDLE
jgi:hypothetical protein